ESGCFGFRGQHPELTALFHHHLHARFDQSSGGLELLVVSIHARFGFSPALVVFRPALVVFRPALVVFAPALVGFPPALLVLPPVLVGLPPALLGLPPVLVGLPPVLLVFPKELVMLTPNGLGALLLLENELYSAFQVHVALSVTWT